MPTPPRRTISSKNRPPKTTREEKRGITTAAGWKKSGGGKVPVELELPSGHIVLAKKPALQELLTGNILPDLLSQMAQQQMEAAKGNKSVKEPEFDFHKVMQEQGPEGIAQFFDAFDRIASYVVKEPVLLYHKQLVSEEGAEEEEWEDIPDDERDEEVVYTDEVDFNDRAFIGQWAMSGQADLASFR